MHGVSCIGPQDWESWKLEASQKDSQNYALGVASEHRPQIVKWIVGRIVLAEITVFPVLSDNGDSHRIVSEQSGGWAARASILLL